MFYWVSEIPAILVGYANKDQSVSDLCIQLSVAFVSKVFDKKLLRFDWSRSSVVLESSGSASA